MTGTHITDADGDAVARLKQKVAALEAALKAAILNTGRVVRKGGADIDWTDDVKAWAALCGLDLSRCGPSTFSWF